MEDKFVSSESILSRMSLCSYFVNWKMYLFTCKKLPLWAAQKWLFYSAGMKKGVFCGISFCNIGILWKKCWIYFCDPSVLTKLFSAKSKIEDPIYMGIIYMSFLSRNLLCKNIYTMSSFMWSNELFSILKGWLFLHCIFLFSFLT